MLSPQFETQELRKLIVDGLNLDPSAAESIGLDTPLFGPETGLDSVDALEIVVLLEKAFDVKIDSDQMSAEAFSTLESLATFVRAQMASSGSASE